MAAINIKLDIEQIPAFFGRKVYRRLTGPWGQRIRLPHGPTVRTTNYTDQPCASRTAIIDARMSFQVCCFIITSLGNMQPSQQMC